MPLGDADTTEDLPEMTTQKPQSPPATQRAQGVAAEMQAATPRYDPMARKTSPKGALVMIFSATVHALALFLVWDLLFGDPLEEEEVVMVEMIKREEPTPEPERARPRSIARRTVDTAVTRQREVAQNAVRQLSPVEVQSRVQTVQVDRPQRIEAPTQVEQRKFVTKTRSEFAPVDVAEPVRVPEAREAVRTVTQMQQSAGPRLVEAAGPVVSSTPAPIEAPTLAEGVVDVVASAGDTQGVRTQAVETGNASRYLEGDGETALQPGSRKNCNTDPVCQAYLERIRRKVEARWNPGDGYGAARVQLSFRIDLSGAATTVRVASASNNVLGETCLTAFRHASPFEPPPASIRYLVNNTINATFTTRPTAPGLSNAE
jgi:hypothetical protein